VISASEDVPLKWFRIIEGKRKAFEDLSTGGRSGRDIKKRRSLSRPARKPAPFIRIQKVHGIIGRFRGPGVDPRSIPCLPSVASSATIPVKRPASVRESITRFPFAS
jgi:hypothetical protein